ncbi:bifunctional adenosylcobinamide kinase/adenosylcobinamide-phosphate guanylyltransferase [Cohnella fermenti]|uniref:Uncharacterized protein n=1 Tax=Cohnella fermenti TaxID=2565925 RepID=A0A4S4BPT7_9BACL|nr:bifunctional adenosylcobinamide kinase/adenosylcobinamide-phosphate guanylyltransferase [Cohnella fermenti]THF76082.1 hypothetical protein E6C55_20100 [Cohnella fermenti]
MLWMVTGGVGCGKSVYAERWAASLAREAILLSCPTWPNEREDLVGGRPDESALMEEERVVWMRWKADEKLSDRIDQINLKSNPFRADNRVIVLDSLSGWLRRAVREVRQMTLPPAPAEPPRRGRPKRIPETEDLFALRTDRAGKEFRRVVDALLRYHGRSIVVTEQPAPGLADDPWERWYARELAEANRRLAERSAELRMLVSGVAVEIRGPRMKRGNGNDEDLYSNRR